MSITPSSVPPAIGERESAGASPVSRPWSKDDSTVLLFALIGFTGGAVLPLFFPIPPITTSFLLATGVAALTYRFLGGIQGSSITIGVLKLGGTLAALVGIAMLINHTMIAEESQAYEIKGQVVDETGKPLQLKAGQFIVFPPNIYPDPVGGDFSLMFTTRIDPNGQTVFPRLIICDGSLSGSIDLTPGAKNDVPVKFAGAVINVGAIRLQSLTPASNACETVSQTTTPEEKP